MDAKREGASSKSTSSKARGSRKARPPLTRMPNGLSHASEIGKNKEGYNSGSGSSGGSSGSGASSGSGSNKSSSPDESRGRNSSMSRGRNTNESTSAAPSKESAIDAPPRFLQDGHRSSSSSASSSSASCYGGSGRRSTVSFLSFSSTAHKLASPDANDSNEADDKVIYDEFAKQAPPPPPRRSMSFSSSRSVTPARSSKTSTTSRLSKFSRSPSKDDSSVAAAAAAATAAEGVMVIRKQRVKVFDNDSSDTEVLAWCVADQSLGLRRKPNTEVNRVTCQDNPSVTGSALAAVCTRCPFVVALDFGNCSNLNGDLALLQVSSCVEQFRTYFLYTLPRIQFLSHLIFPS